jgi:alpha-glucosidase (family GH31 glycosyl hydrolase)
VHFPDFFHPNATLYWKDMMQFLYNQVPFSGIWLDMNEVSNMCDGLCSPPTEPAAIDYSKDIPYTPGGGNIEQETIALNSTHYGRVLEANVHPLFGLMHTYNSFEFMKSIGSHF